MNEYLQGVSAMPWFNSDYRGKAIKAAEKAEQHLETMKLHDYSSEISFIEKKRFSAQVVRVTELWNADIDEWLIDKSGKSLSQLLVERED